VWTWKPSARSATASTGPRSNRTPQRWKKLVSPDLVFVGSSGVREGKKEFIASFVDPALKFEPITIADRIFMPLGPDAGVVGGDVVLRGTASGKPFASRIRFADTFRRIDGEWVAVHIQATKVSETAP
jgi:hypothetical protein